MLAAALSGMAATGDALQDQLDWATARGSPATSGDRDRQCARCRRRSPNGGRCSQTDALPFDSYAALPARASRLAGRDGDAPQRRSALGRATASPSTAVALLPPLPAADRDGLGRAIAQALNGDRRARRGEERGARRRGVAGALSAGRRSVRADELPRRADRRSITTRGWTVAVAGRDRRGARQICLDQHRRKRPLFAGAARLPHQRADARDSRRDAGSVRERSRLSRRRGDLAAQFGRGAPARARCWRGRARSPRGRAMSSAGTSCC